MSQVFLVIATTQNGPDKTVVGTISPDHVCVCAKYLIRRQAEKAKLKPVFPAWLDSVAPDRIYQAAQVLNGSALWNTYTIYPITGQGSVEFMRDAELFGVEDKALNVLRSVCGRY